MLRGSKIMFYISLGKNAIVIFFNTVLAYYLEVDVHTPFDLTGHVIGGLPEISMPPFSFQVDGNTLTFGDSISKMGFGLISIIILAISSNVVVGKIFTKGKRMDASQEIIALGVTNIFGSFMSSIPVCGSFSRSAVNNASGVRTTLSGVYSALMVVLALEVLTPWFYYIPRAGLAAVVIAAVLSMIDYKILLPMWKTSRKDLIPTFVTFILSMIFGIEIGLLLGVGIDLMFILYYSSRPSFTFDKMEINSQPYWIVTPMNGLLYPSSNYLQKLVKQESSKTEKAEGTVFVLNLLHVFNIDFTAVQVLKSVVDEFKMNYKDCVTLNARKSIVQQLEHAVPGLLHVSSLESHRLTIEKI